MSDWLGDAFSGDWFGSVSDSIPDASIDTSGWDWGSAVDTGGWDQVGGGDSSWWGSLTNALGGTSGLTRLVGGALGAGGNVLARNQATSGANQAAAIQAAANAAALDKILAANKEARDVMIQRSDRGLADIDAGLGSFKSTLNPLLTPNPVVIPQHRGLTDQQQIGLEDLRRSGLASLSATGMRGAGRAGIGTIMDQERRYRAAAAAGNDADTRQELRRAQGVADSARGTIAAGELQTGGAKANANMMVGNNLASSITSGGQSAGSLTAQTGQSAADAARTTGAIGANATTSTANVLGDTVGQLGAIIADQRRYSSPGSSWGV